jgi:hypothetical protein
MHGSQIPLSFGAMNPDRITAMSFDGQKTKTWLEFFTLLAKDSAVKHHCDVNEILGMVLTPGQDATAFHCEFTDPALRRTLLRSILKAEFSVCYCSVFDECWVASNRTRSVSVPRCPERGPESFTQLDYDDTATAALFDLVEDAGLGPSDGSPE